MESASFTRTFPIQSPNPNTNSFSSQSQSLSTTISSLSSLLSFSTQNRTSRSALLGPQNANLVPCPFNSHHLMPPESLFLHYLRCPSPLRLDPTSCRSAVGDAAALPRQRTTHFVKGNGGELCFSLDEFYDDFRTSFFYRDCPGVVSLYDVDDSKKTFSLPPILSVECADFDCSGERGVEGIEKEGIQVLPSVLWAIRREVEGWVEYPTAYSFNVVCAILGSEIVKENDLRRWVIVNSPRFGIVVDGFVRDQIFLLLRLCLKAVVREAHDLTGVMRVKNDAKEKVVEANLSNMTFKCPVLAEVLTWLGSQLSCLCGDINGKFFAINMLKQCVLEAASQLSFLPSEENITQSNKLREQSHRLDANGGSVKGIKVEEPLDRTIESEVHKTSTEAVDDGPIFVSQVVTAVAALHERSFLEHKIRQLRASQGLTRYQRLAEYGYVSARADEERKKRPNYSPIIDHDGLPRQPSSDQNEMNRTKTREEILAEERDYKRRRMSYRGKKLKRTTLQVMRDIIEEYTEEIKKAGGIGCFTKGAEEGGMPPLEVPVSYEPSGGIDKLKRRTNNVSESTVSSIDLDRRGSQYFVNKSSRFENDLGKDYVRSRHGQKDHYDHVEHESSNVTDRFAEGYHSRSLKRQNKEKYHSGGAERHISHGWSREQSHGRGRDYTEPTRTKYHENRRESSSMSKYHDYGSPYSLSASSNEDRTRKHDRRFHVQDCSLHEHDGSVLVGQNGFDDRYDPSESSDVS